MKEGLLCDETWIYPKRICETKAYCIYGTDRVKDKTPVFQKPAPASHFFLLTHISLQHPHNLKAWNRLDLILWPWFLFFSHTELKPCLACSRPWSSGAQTKKKKKQEGDCVYSLSFYLFLFFGCLHSRSCSTISMPGIGSLTISRSWYLSTSVSNRHPSCVCNSQLTDLLATRQISGLLALILPSGFMLKFQTMFLALWASVWSKNKREGAGPPGPLPWICHCRKWKLTELPTDHLYVPV